MDLKRIEGPAQEPVSLGEMRSWLRLGTSTAHDETLGAVIPAAREEVEAYLRRSLLTQTWRAAWDRAELAELVNEDGDYEFPLLMPPVQSVVRVLIAGEVTTEFEFVGGGDAGRVVIDSMLLSGVRGPEAVIVEFVCGFGDEPTDVPQNIRTGIKRRGAAHFENRDDLEQTFDALTKGALAAYRLLRVG